LVDVRGYGELLVPGFAPDESFGVCGVRRVENRLSLLQFAFSMTVVNIGRC
jgi:hypothetical protein